MSSDKLFIINYFFNLILFALLPNTNNNDSIKFDFPEPFGPTIAVKFFYYIFTLWKGFIIVYPSYDLKFSSIILLMTKRVFAGINLFIN